MSKSWKLIFAVIASLTFNPLTTANATSVICDDPGPGQNLSFCDFSDVDLSGYDLEGSILTGANLSNTNLSGASLKGVSSGNITGTPSSLPEDWVVIGGYLLGPEAELSSAKFTDLNLKNINLNQATLDWAVFINSDLSNTNLSDTKLRHTVMVGTNVAGTNFKDANMDYFYSNTLKGTPSVLPSDWNMIQGHLVGPKADLNGTSFEGVDFRNQNIDGIYFAAAHFLNSDFSDMDLSNTTITSAIFVNTKFDGTKLGNNDLHMVCAAGVIGTPDSLPANWKLRSGFLIGPGANLTTQDMTNVNFTGLDLTGAALSASNLTNANLSGVDLSKTSIEDVNVSRANLQNTNLTGLSLRGWIAANVTGEPIGLNPDWQSLNGYLLGPGANLSTVNFSGVDLRNAKLKDVNFIYANLSGANLAGVDLSGVNMTGVNLNGANLTGSNLKDTTLNLVAAQNIVGTPINLPEPWKFKGRSLLGPDAVLYQANLTGLDLRDVDLSRANIGEANFTGADLRGAKLTGALIQDAVFSNTNLYNVVTGSLRGTPNNLPANFKLEDGTIKSILVLSPIPKTTGVAKVGSKLTAVPGTWDNGVTVSYQWLRNGEVIEGATSQDYLLGPDDFRKGISVTVTGTGTGGVSKSKQSLDKPIAVGLMKAVTPKIFGTVAKGKTIKVVVAPWVANSSITYSWLLDGKAIKGATKSSYKLLSSQVGKKISVSVKQVAFGYTTTTKVSAAQKVK